MTENRNETDYISLYERLKAHNEEGIYPFHMPGHKRYAGKAPVIDPYGIDITEIDGFDDLHHPEGCIMEAEERAAKLYGTFKTYYLINGCTGGILAAISACCGRKDGILIARNCHKAVYNVVMINRLRPYYVWPERHVITPASVKEALEEHDDIGCVVITSPTYEGYTSDISEIADIVHEYGITLIVDEAHGAHFPWSDMFPESSIKLGADIVIHGIHKTLPSLTQTALLHVCSDRIDLTEIRRYLSVYQSSSPSYVLMGSIDHCLEYIRNDMTAYDAAAVNGGTGICDTDHSESDYRRYTAKLRRCYEQLAELKNLYVLPWGSDRDASKIVICTDRVEIDGLQCYNILRHTYDMQPEMYSAEHVILMTSVWDSDDSYDRLVQALKEIDGGLDSRVSEDPEEAVSSGTDVRTTDKTYRYPHNETVTDIHSAVHADSMDIIFEGSAGYISCDMVYLYPPGIPYIVPGERISAECVGLLDIYKKRGYAVKGMADMEGRLIRVMK